MVFILAIRVVCVITLLGRPSSRGTVGTHQQGLFFVFEGCGWRELHDGRRQWGLVCDFSQDGWAEQRLLRLNFWMKCCFSCLTEDGTERLSVPRHLHSQLHETQKQEVVRYPAGIICYINQKTRIDERRDLFFPTNRTQIDFVVENVRWNGFVPTSSRQP